MSHENEHDRLGGDERTQIERRLKALLPAPAQVDRDRLMFLAGRASAKASGGRESPDNDASHDMDAVQTGDVTGKLTLPARRERSSGPHWMWPAATATFAATSLALLCAMIARPMPQPQIVYRDQVIRVAAQPQQSAESNALPAANHSAVPITLAVHQRQPASAVPADNYVRTREVALRMGLDAIGAPRSAGSDAPRSTNYGDWLQTPTGQSSDE